MHVSSPDTEWAASVLKCRTQVQAVIIAMVRDFDLADDLLQETLLELLKSQSRYDPQFDFIRWAKGVARNVVLRHWSRQKHAPTLVDPSNLVTLAEAMDGDAEEEDTSLWEDERRKLRRCLGQLTARNRNLFLLRYGGNFKGAALAEQSGFNLNSIRTTLLRVRSFLRRCLRSRGNSPTMDGEGNMTDRFEELLSKYLDSDLSRAELQQLCEWLKADADCRRRFREELRLHTLARGIAAERLNILSLSQSSNELPASQSRHWLRQHWLPLAACLTLMGILTASLVLLKSNRPLQIISIQGEGRLIRQGIQHPALTGTILQPGDILQTGSDGLTILAYESEASRLALKENTELKLPAATSYKRLELLAGTIEALVAPQRKPMVVIAPQAAARILGTHFRLSADQSRTSLEVLDGIVQLNRTWDGASVHVPRRYSAVASRKENLAPERLIGSISCSFTNPTQVIARKVRPLVINGLLDESEWRFTRKFNRKVLGKYNNTVEFGTLWDSQCLYVGIKVADSRLRKDSEVLWQDDSIELYLASRHDSSVRYNEFDRQFIKRWNDSFLFEKEGRTNGVRHAWASVPGGFTVELAIPWSHLNLTPINGLTFGLDIGNNDDDNNEERDGQGIWIGTDLNHTDTSMFGDCILKD